MSLSNEQRHALGRELFEALRDCKTLAPLTERVPQIEIEDAYHISRAMLENRLAHSGEKIVGKKIGVTSKPVQDMLGVFQPDFGFLTDRMEVPNASEVKIAGNLISRLPDRWRDRLLR